MAPTTAGRFPVALALFAAVFFEGVMLASIGPTLDALADQSGSTLGRISILFTANSLGYIVGSLAAGRTFARAAGNTVLAVALVAMAALTATIPLLGSLWLLMAVLAGIGVAIGFVDVGGNTLIVWLYRSDVPPYMNALHLSFGVGAFLSPLVIDRFAVAFGDATSAFWLFAGLMLPVAAWLRRRPTPRQPDTAATPPTTRASSGMVVVRRHALLIGLLAVLFFFHVGAELAFGGWIFSYADEVGIGPATTARVLNSAFWGGLVIGRLLAIPLSLRLKPASMLQVDLVGAAASLGVIAFLGDWSPSLWIGTIGFGVSIASMFASCINYAGERMPITSEVTAVFLVGGSLGSMSLPWLVGQLFEDRGPESMIYVVGSAVVLGLVLFGIIRAYAGSRRPPATSDG
jgi:FHS family Na+ dependent glucose MFS transporter 1